MILSMTELICLEDKYELRTRFDGAQFLFISLAIGNTWWYN